MKIIGYYVTNDSEILTVTKQINVKYNGFTTINDKWLCFDKNRLYADLSKATTRLQRQLDSKISELTKDIKEVEDVLAVYKTRLERLIVQRKEVK